MLAQTFGRLRAESRGRCGVRFERVYDYTPEELWAAITEPEQVRGWLGEAELDLSEGGEGRVTFDEDDVATLQVRRIEPGRLVEYDWTFPNEPQSVLRLEVEPREHGTLLVLDHSLLAEDDITEYSAGWHSHLDWLDAHLGGRSFDFTARYRELTPMYGAMRTG
jgi:uncharacterized protein YndB with AHSA1/START domain